MSMTNCINCGASKEVSDLQCPFCGTKYADLTTIDPFHDHELYIQFRGVNGAVRTAKAYITNTEMQFHPEVTLLYSMKGMVNRHVNAINVTGSIDFTLYENIEGGS